MSGPQYIYICPKKIIQSVSMETTEKIVSVSMETTEKVVSVSMETAEIISSA